MTMIVPAVLFIAAMMWLLMSLIKYWYYSKFEIHYKHKIDENLLKAILQPPPQFWEKIGKIQKEREKNSDLDPTEFYNSQRIRDIRNGKDPDAATNDKDGLPKSDGNSNPDEKTSNANDTSNKPKGRPLTLFEEMDLLNEQKKNKKRQPPRYDRSIFEDSLSILHKKLQEGRKQAAGMKQKASASESEEKQETKSPKKVSFSDLIEDY